MRVISRDAAMRRGFLKYFTGLPCRHGHVTQRDVATQKCSECERLRHKAYNVRKSSDPTWLKKQSLRSAAWNKANPERKNANNRRSRQANVEKARSANKQWRQTNSEKVKADLRRWVAANPGLAREYGRRWRANNPDYVAAKLRLLATEYKNASKTNRRAKMKSLGQRVSEAELKAIKNRARGRCANCRKKAKLEFDHIKPICRGGSHSAKNLQMLCRPCNLRKGRRDPIEWARANGRLDLVEIYSNLELAA